MYKYVYKNGYLVGVDAFVGQNERGPFDSSLPII